MTTERFSNTVNASDFALAPRCCHSTHAASTQSHRRVKNSKNESEKYMARDVHITTCETAWTHRKHTVNAQSEIGATVTVTVDRIDVDRVAKPP